MLFTSLKRLLSTLGCLLLFCLVTQTHAGPIDNPSIVNTVIAGNQGLPALTNMVAGRNGEKLLMWRDHEVGITYVQRISSSGVLAPAKMPIQGLGSSISADLVGNFIVASDSANIRRYDRNGNLQSTFRPHPDAVNASAVVDVDGNVSVFYSISVNQVTSLAFRRFTTAGIPVSAEVQVWGPTTQYLGVVASGSDAFGNVTVTWQVMNSSTPLDVDIWMQRFNSAGQAINSPTLVPSALPGLQDGGGLAVSPQGPFAIAWNSLESSSNWGAYVQRFNSAGFPVGTPIRLNQAILSASPLAYVSMAEDGSFVATWNTNPTPPEVRLTLVARQFNADGTPIGNEFKVDLPGIGSALYANSAMDRAGNFTVAWSAGEAPPGTSWDVKMRSFKLDTQPAITALINNQPAQSLAGGTGSWRYFKVTLPAGVTQMNINMAGPAGGDGDMYVRFGGLPSATAWDFRPYVNGSNEALAIGTPPPGDFYIAIYGYSAYSAVSLNVSYW